MNPDKIARNARIAWRIRFGLVVWSCLILLVAFWHPWACAAMAGICPLINFYAHTVEFAHVQEAINLPKDRSKPYRGDLND